MNCLFEHQVKIFSGANVGLVPVVANSWVARHVFQADLLRRISGSIVGNNQIEMMIAEFKRMAAELDREIGIEEQKSGVKDVTHYAYSTYARAARTRRDNLLHSADELQGQLEEARLLFDQATDDLAKAQVLEGRDKAPVLGDLTRDVMDLAALRGARA